jgi:hypothetical protein
MVPRKPAAKKPAKKKPLIPVAKTGSAAGSLNWKDCLYAAAHKAVVMLVAVLWGAWESLGTAAEEIKQNSIQDVKLIPTYGWWIFGAVLAIWALRRQHKADNTKPPEAK